MIKDKSKKTVVLGVLGVDAHVVGNKIMAHLYWSRIALAEVVILVAITNKVMVME